MLLRMQQRKFPSRQKFTSLLDTVFNFLKITSTCSKVNEYIDSLLPAEHSLLCYSLCLREALTTTGIGVTLIKFTIMIEIHVMAYAYR